MCSSSTIASSATCFSVFRVGVLTVRHRYGSRGRVVSRIGRAHRSAPDTVYRLTPGTMYALDEHDRHRIDATMDMRIVCVFSPALAGPETHDEDGSYPLLED